MILPIYTESVKTWNSVYIFCAVSIGESKIRSIPDKITTCSIRYALSSLEKRHKSFFDIYLCLSAYFVFLDVSIENVAGRSGDRIFSLY